MNKKALLTIVLKAEDNKCEKCCKTRQVVERMLEALPELSEKLDIQFKNVLENEPYERFGVIIPPLVMINDKVFSEGHVPIIKKLSRDLLTIINQ